MTELHKPVVTLLPDLVGCFVADAEAAALARATGRPRGAVTRLSGLDDALGGYLAPGIHILQAAPGAGKTALALQIASDCAYPCLYITSEMGLLELFRRLIARQTKTFLGKLKSGELGGPESRRLALQTVENLPQLALMDATQAYASPSYICDVANDLRARFNSDHVLIVLDSLQIWAKSARRAAPDLTSTTEYDLISHGLDGISGVAAKLQCPILAVSHRNRAGNNSGGGLHAGKGSGDLEYGAETVIDLIRKDETPDANGEIKVTATLQKNRHGIPGVSVDFAFSGRTQSFREK
jgi:replicative DNA helicase